jgi:thioesterase domain-containing protein
MACKNLFMIPDGSGSAYSYSELGSLGSEWAIWGLVSPFMKSPHEYTCGVEGIAGKFLEEMKQRQPVGPYVLAGWSIGGTIAYEITRQLTRSDEQVSHLILIDAPCPLLDDPLPRHLGRWFADIGIIGSKMGASLCIPDWILPHFDMSAKAFADYKPVPISRDHCPNTMAVWCEDGVCRTQQDPRPHPYPTGHALFLLENREDFGPNRWDELLASEKIQTRRMRGNHFTMMREPLVCFLLQLGTGGN